MTGFESPTLRANAHATDTLRALDGVDPDDSQATRDQTLARAQVHATLAVAEEIRDLRESLERLLGGD